MTGIKKMKNGHSIVTKEADKARIVVTMDSAHYEQIIYKQFEDKNSYKNVNPPCENKTMRE